MRGNSLDAMLAQDPILTEEAPPNSSRPIKQAVLREMLSLIARPDILSFALGLPAAELFPVNALEQAAERVLRTDSRALQYGPPYEPLKTLIVELMTQRGVSCREDQLLLTAGAQQGLSLLTHLLLDRGGQLMTEESTYTNFRLASEPFNPITLTVATDLKTGIDVDAVEERLAGGARPRLIYIITNGHNPLGVTISQANRIRLVELACRYRVPIVEDDPYALLYYDNNPLPPLRALDQEWILHVGSFSKIVAPALRVGWVVVPKAMIPALSAIKEAADIDTSTFTQRTVAAFIEGGDLPDHLSVLRREYRLRRDTMLRALRRYFPPEASWHEPSSGIFIWVELPGGVDTTELLRVAIETEQIAFLPGNAFSVPGDHRASHCMRLSFSNCSPERINDGIERLGHIVSAAIARSSAGI